MSDRNYLHLYSTFREKVSLVIADMNLWTAKHKPGYTAIVVEGLRSAEYQHELWEQGRSKPGAIVTYKDGFKHPSNHQTGLAVDIVPQNGKTIDWDDMKFYTYLQHVAHVHGLVSGADWKGFRDLDHIEWRVSDHEMYQKADAWLIAQGLK